MVKIKYIPLTGENAKYKSRYSMDPDRIVVHNTAADAMAEPTIRWMQSTPEYTSFHFAVDDVEAVQGLKLNQNGWHASDGVYGDGNRKGIAIEICLSYIPERPGDGMNDEQREAKWQKIYRARFEKAQENAAELIAYLFTLYEWKFDKKRITKHQDYCGKYCPHRTMSDYGWDWFLNLCEKKYEEMMEDQPMTKEEKQVFEDLKKKVEKQAKAIKDLNDQVAPRWGYIDSNLAKEEWLEPTVKKLVKKGFLKGDETGNLQISFLMARLLVILDRAGCFNL